MVGIISYFNRISGFHNKKKCNPSPRVSSKALFSEKCSYSNTQIMWPWYIFWCAGVWGFYWGASARLCWCDLCQARVETTAGFCCLWSITLLVRSSRAESWCILSLLSGLPLDFISAEEKAKLVFDLGLSRMCGWGMAGSKCSSKIFMVPLSLLVRV